MITVAIQLVFQNRAKMSHQEVTNYLIEHLPEGEIVLASGPTKEGEVRLKLDQNALTDQQRDFLHLDEIAQQYIDTFEVLPGKPSTPTSKSWEEMKCEMENLRQRVSVLEHNNSNVINQRFRDFFNGMDLPQAPQQETIDQGRLRDLIYAIEDTVQRARDLLAPIYKDNTLNQVDTELGNAMDTILDLREMLGEETP